MDDFLTLHLTAPGSSFVVPNNFSECLDVVVIHLLLRDGAEKEKRSLKAYEIHVVLSSGKLPHPLLQRKINHLVLFCGGTQNKSGRTAVNSDHLALCL